MHRHPLAPVFEEVLRLPCIDCRRSELLDMPRYRLAKPVMREDAHEFAKINVCHALVAANDDHVLVIGIHAWLAPVGGTGQRHGFGAEWIDKHELGMHPVDVDADRAVEPV